MQAIILAAGMGKRLGELTHNNTKCMVKVNGVTLIDRVLTQLSKFNLQRVVIVIGYEGQKLKDYIGQRYDNKLKIEYVTNPIYDKTNNIYSLALAKQQLQEDDTLLLESDLIFEDSLLEIIMANPYPDLALVAKYETWMDGTMVRIDSENNIINFIPQKAFQYQDAQYYYKTINIYKFSKNFLVNQYIPFLDAYSKVMGNNEYYEQVLRVLTILDRTGLKALPIKDQNWYEIDDIQDLDIAETIFSDNQDRIAKYLKRYGGYWRFPKLKDFCYLVNPYFPTQRMKEEIKANFDTLLAEYPSGNYVNTLLGAKYFGIKQKYVCIGNGAAELIKCIMEKDTDKKIGITYPTFEEYPHRLKKEQIIQYIPTNRNFNYTAKNLISFFDNKKISTLLIINPDNPSGNFIERKDLLMLVDWCQQQQIQVIIDESFVDFTNDYKLNSLIDNHVIEKYSNLVVIKSLSKSYGIPGLRLGILVSSNQELVTYIRKSVCIWNINSFAEFYLQIYGKYEKYYTNACDKIIEERNYLFNKLNKISFIRVIPSQANYFLCEIIDKYTATELAQILLEKFNILIKDCNTKAALENKNYIRLAIRDRQDNQILIDALNNLDKE